MKTKKSMSLRKYHLLRFWSFFICFATMIFSNTAEFCGFYNNIWAEIAVIVMGLTGAVLTIMFMSAQFTRKIDKEDELAKSNLSMAREGVSITVMFLLLLAAFVSAIVNRFTDYNITFTLNNHIMCDIIFTVLWGYFSLESGFFLIIEGREYSDEDEIEEEKV